MLTVMRQTMNATVMRVPSHTPTSRRTLFLTSRPQGQVTGSTIDHFGSRDSVLNSRLPTLALAKKIKKSLQNATPNEGGHLWCAFWVQSLTWRNIMHTVCCGSPNWSVDLTSNEKVQIQQGAKPSSAHRVSIISRTVAHSVSAECSSYIREV